MTVGAVAQPPPPKITITKPSDRKYRSLLVYGPTGAGKSWFGASGEAKLGGRTLFAMTEDAETGLEGFDVDITHARSAEQMWAILRALRAGQPPFDAYRDGVLVVDSLTQAQKFFLAEDAEAAFKKGNTNTPLSIPLDAYKRVSENIRRMLWYARTLPMHVVYICLDREFVTEDGVLRMTGPDLTPQLSGDVRAYCDVVGYLRAEVRDVREGGSQEKKLVRLLYLEPGKGFYARVRAGRGVSVPPFIANPTLGKVLSIFQKGVKEGE
ncbi:MAG: AAA family ATPase [Armatimonadota bacterium]|nr:AAA family ATPase [Armatimonadota bacterium]